MTSYEIAIVLAGALAGGFVNGLTGFGTGLTALGIWLHVLPPPVAASLVILTSVSSQLQTLPMIWRRIDWSRARTFVAPGLLGAPIGALILSSLDVDTFKSAIGAFLGLYCGLALLPSASTGGYSWGGRPLDATVGFASGILGGLAGLSGALMVMWSDVRGGTKDARRSLLQVFNLSVLLMALGSHAVTGHLTPSVGWAFLAALPGSIIGAEAGARTYARLGDRDYKRIVLALLFLSGLVLVGSAR